jgi:acyl carrier protein
MEQKVIELLKRVFKSENISSESSQDSIAEWDSMNQLSIAFELESEFGISLEPEDLEQLKSVKDIVKVLETKK